jgi:LPXTG-motif cell wall-anchored protein
MASAWRSRIAVAVATAGIAAFGISSPAWADTTISINSGNVAGGGAVAATYPQHSCAPNLGGGAYAGRDVWVFNLPSDGSASQKSRFVSITATFDTGSGTVTKTIPSDGTIVFIGTSKAYVVTDAGWKLTGATAVVTKAEPFFVLTHTCPAGYVSPSTGVVTTVPPTTAPGTPAPSSPAVTSPAASTTQEAPGGGSPSTEAAPTTAPRTSQVADESGLPITGTALSGVVVTGVGLVAAGVAMLFLRRRRKGAHEAGA